MIGQGFELAWFARDTQYLAILDTADRRKSNPMFHPSIQAIAPPRMEAIRVSESRQGGSIPPGGTITVILICPYLLMAKNRSFQFRNAGFDSRYGHRAHICMTRMAHGAWHLCI